MPTPFEIITARILRSMLPTGYDIVKAETDVEKKVDKSLPRRKLNSEQILKGLDVLTEKMDIIGISKNRYDLLKAEYDKLYNEYKKLKNANQHRSI
jgi:hypothetical protein